MKKQFFYTQIKAILLLTAFNLASQNELNAQPNPYADYGIGGCVDCGKKTYGFIKKPEPGQPQRTKDQFIVDLKTTYFASQHMQAFLATGSYLRDFYGWKDENGQRYEINQTRIIPFLQSSYKDDAPIKQIFTTRVELDKVTVTSYSRPTRKDETYLVLDPNQLPGISKATVYPKVPWISMQCGNPFIVVSSSVSVPAPSPLADDGPEQTPAPETHAETKTVVEYRDREVPVYVHTGGQSYASASVGVSMGMSLGYTPMYIPQQQCCGGAPTFIDNSYTDNSYYNNQVTNIHNPPPPPVTNPSTGWPQEGNGGESVDGSGGNPTEGGGGPRGYNGTTNTGYTNPDPRPRGSGYQNSASSYTKPRRDVRNDNQVLTANTLKGNEPSAYNGPSRSRERTSDVTPKGHKQNYNSAPRPRSNTNTHTGPSRQNLNNSFNHAKNVNSSKNFNNSRVNAPRQSGGNRNNSGGNRSGGPRR